MTKKRQVLIHQRGKAHKRVLDRARSLAWVRVRDQICHLINSQVANQVVSQASEASHGRV